MLLERGPELTELSRALHDAQEGRGRVVVIEAAAGMGKTSLLRAASEQAGEAGFTRLRTRATQLEHDFAYGCVRQLFEPIVASAAESRQDRLFAGAAALSKPLFDPADIRSLSSVSDTSFTTLHGLYWLLNNLADEGPIVLLIDDLHWVDAASLRFLNYLGPRLDGLRVAVLAATRSGEHVPPDLARMTVGPETTVLHPVPLGLEGTATLCAHHLGADVPQEFSAACFTATGGNPFYLDALLREVRDEKITADANEADRVQRIGPAAVAQAVLLRLSEAPAETGAVVRAVAVLGDGASLAEAAALAEVPEGEAAAAADRLAAQEILMPGTRLEFAHPILREAVYADAGPRERAAAHARAARVLAACGASEERVAAQIAEAEPAGDAARVDVLRRVAADALVRGAPDAAVAWLRRAMAEPPRPSDHAAVLLDLGFAELRIAAPEAVEHLAEARSRIREPSQLATSARLLANALTWARNSDRAIEVLERAIHDVEPADRELALMLEADLAAHAQEASREARAPAAQRLDRFANLPGTTPGERLVSASLAFERARASESSSEAEAYLRSAFADGRLLDEQDLDVAPTIYVLVVGLLATDALDLADEILDRMLADARRRNSIPAVAFVLAHQAVAALRHGSLARAEADARTALDVLTAYAIPLGTALSLGVLVEALVGGGDVDAAEHVLAQSGLGTDIPPGMPSNRLLEARGYLRLAQGRVDAGLDDLVEFGRRDELWGGAHPLASRWRSRAAIALSTTSDTARARATARDDLERARRWGAPSGIGLALRAYALAHGGSVDQLRASIEVLESSVARLDHAYALADLGAALRRANRRTEARGTLHDALHLAEHCNARALVQHVRTELRAAGGRSSVPAGTGVEQLTASERRVAELAADGLSNPEIAESLFVTRKTVETHLGSVYRKLDISGRGKLRRALG